MRLVTIALAGVVSLTGPAPVNAQGVGHGQPPDDPGRRGNSAATTSAQPPSAPAGAGVRLQTFGSWLDTARVSAPGEAWISISSAYWRSPSLREVDAPAIGVSAGVAQRMQVGVSLPYYHVTDRTGYTSRGFGASYLTAKVALSEHPDSVFSVTSWLGVRNEIRRVVTG